MKDFLLALLPNLTTKAAVTAAVCVTTGAAVTATATTVVYNHKAAQYEKEIESLEAAQSDDATASPQGQKKGGQAPADVATAVRVVDGILEVWDGTQWTDYGSVDDIQSGDPYYDGGNDEKRQQLEQSVAAKKLDELGLKINEEGQIVPKAPEEMGVGEVVADKKKTLPILVGNSINDGKQATQNNTKNSSDATSDKKKQTATASSTNTVATAGLTPEQVMAAIQGSGSIASMPMSASSTVTTVSWTASDSGGGGGDGGGGGGPDPYSSNSGGGGGSSDSGGGGGGSSDSGSSSSDSGGGDSGGSSDSGSSGSDSDSGGFNEGGSDDDCGDDVK